MSYSLIEYVNDGDLNVIKKLIEMKKIHKYDIMKQDVFGNSMLLDASFNGFLDVIKFYVENV